MTRLRAFIVAAAVLLAGLALFAQSPGRRWNDQFHDVTLWLNSEVAVKGDSAGRLATELSAVTVVTNVSSPNTSVTLTLPAAGAGLFHYITAITATRSCTAAITGSALLTYTSTNLPGTLNWTAGNACAVGSTNQDIASDFTHPLKSSAADTATTIVAPAAGTAGTIRVTAYYFTGQ